MITYLRRKFYENRVKLVFYRAINDLLMESGDIIQLVSDLYGELKDVPVEELKDSFISKIAELAHEQAMKERDENA